MQEIAHVCKIQRQKERNKHSNNSLRERRRNYLVHITDIR